MKDFKKILKMADGGKVDMSWDDIQKYVDDAPKRKAEAEKRMKTYEENTTKNMAQSRENMRNIGKEYHTKMADLKAKYQPSRVSGASGSAGGGDMSGMKGLDKPYKRGGKVKKK